MHDELISKKQPFEKTRMVTRGGEWLFGASIIAFLLALAILGGLFLFQRTLKSNAANWREQVDALEKELRPDLLNQLVALSDKLTSARDILVNHVFSSNTLALLEKSTHPRVFFSTFQYSSQARTITLSAKAANYSAVAEQITMLEADPQIERVHFGGLTLDERGLVGFKLTIMFKPGLLGLRPQL